MVHYDTSFSLCDTVFCGILLPKWVPTRLIALEKKEHSIFLESTSALLTYGSSFYTFLAVASFVNLLFSWIKRWKGNKLISQTQFHVTISTCSQHFPGKKCIYEKATFTSWPQCETDAWKFLTTSMHSVCLALAVWKCHAWLHDLIFLLLEKALAISYYCAEWPI